MKAIVYYRPGDARLEDVPVPVPGPGELLVKVGTALTCGTDDPQGWADLVVWGSASR
jgi:threonine dehydrogenase-like Zn-dependent dehydrogenase